MAQPETKGYFSRGRDRRVAAYITLLADCLRGWLALKPDSVTLCTARSTLVQLTTVVYATCQIAFPCVSAWTNMVMNVVRVLESCGLTSRLPC